MQSCLSLSRAARPQCIARQLRNEKKWMVVLVGQATNVRDDSCSDSCSALVKIHTDVALGLGHPQGANDRSSGSPLLSVAAYNSITCGSPTVPARQDA